MDSLSLGLRVRERECDRLDWAVGVRRRWEVRDPAATDHGEYLCAVMLDGHGTLYCSCGGPLCPHTQAIRDLLTPTPRTAA